MSGNLASEIEFVTSGTGCRRHFNIGLPEWFVNAQSVNKFKGDLDHYIRKNRGIKSVKLTLSPLEPFALSYMLVATVLGKLGKLGKLDKLCKLCKLSKLGKLSKQVSVMFSNLLSAGK